MSWTSLINKAAELFIWGFESIYYAKDKLTLARRIKIMSVSGTIKNIPQQENQNAYSQADVLLKLKNTGKKQITIGKILIEYTQKELKPIYDYEADAGMKKLITPLKASMIEGGQNKEISLKYINNPLQKKQENIHAMLRLYSNEHRLLKKIKCVLQEVS